MGLFDALQFDPTTYQSPQGGLLSRLQALIAQQSQYNPQSSGFPQQDQGAAIPANAQPAQAVPGAPMQIAPQMPASPAPEQQSFLGGLGDRLSAGLQGFGGQLPEGSPIKAIFNGAMGLASGENPATMQNQTARALVAKGLDPSIAQQVVKDPGLMRAVLPHLFDRPGQTDDIKEYEYAKKEDPALTFEKFMQRKKSVTGEYSLNPVYGTNEKGETVLMQTGKGGEAIQTKLPPGIKVSSGVEKIDLGTQWGIIDKKSGNMVGTQPKDIVGKESAEERGKALGQAQVALPNVIANAEQTLKTIQSVKSDPYLSRGTGMTSVLNNVPGTGGYDFGQKVEQLRGKTFLEAFNSLKGGGAITDVEGRKAENAIARLSTGQSEKSFREALNELEEVVTIGMERAYKRAGVAPPASAKPSSVGGNASLKSKYGLD